MKAKKNKPEKKEEKTKPLNSVLEPNNNEARSQHKVEEPLDEEESIKLFCVEMLNDTENFKIEDEEGNNYYSLGGDNDLINPEEF
jgi:hypothetical protein